MDLKLSEWLPSPVWTSFEKMMNVALGKKMCRKVANAVRISAGALKTYFSDVFNPIVKRDFKEKKQIQFHEGKFLQGW